MDLLQSRFAVIWILFIPLSSHQNLDYTLQLDTTIRLLSIKYYSLLGEAGIMV